MGLQINLKEIEKALSVLLHDLREAKGEIIEAETIDLFTLVRMHRELEELLHRKVDIVTEKSLHPSFKPYVERNLQIIADFGMCF